MATPSPPPVLAAVEWLLLCGCGVAVLLFAWGVLDAGEETVPETEPAPAGFGAGVGL